jgi:hypothetical protein
MVRSSVSCFTSATIARFQIGAFANPVSPVPCRRRGSCASSANGFSLARGPWLIRLSWALVRTCVLQFRTTLFCPLAAAEIAPSSLRLGRRISGRISSDACTIYREPARPAPNVATIDPIHRGALPTFQDRALSRAKSFPPNTIPVSAGAPFRELELGFIWSEISSQSFFEILTEAFEDGELTPRSS